MHVRPYKPQLPIMLSRRLWGSVRKNHSSYRGPMPASLYTQDRRYKSSYLLRAVKTDETERLDIQHRMNLHMMHQAILHPSIPKNLQHVADVATGNGTWLLDLAKTLQEKEPESESKNTTRYHGFDISPALFPKTESHSFDIDFSAHDFYEPFPEEHLGKYDLVHARHLVLAVQGADLILAIKNISSLLKPGGHLQWEEYDFRHQLSKCPPCKLTDVWYGMLGWVEDRGYSLTFSDAVRDEALAAGLEVLDKTQFSTAGLPIAADHRLTLYYSFATGVPRISLKAGGKSDEEIEKMVEEALAELDRGLVLDYYLSRVVCRKPLSPPAR